MWSFPDLQRHCCNETIWKKNPFLSICERIVVWMVNICSVTVVTRQLYLKKMLPHPKIWYASIKSVLFLLSLNESAKLILIFRLFTLKLLSILLLLLNLFSFFVIILNDYFFFGTSVAKNTCSFSMRFIVLSQDQNNLNFFIRI